MEISNEMGHRHLRPLEHDPSTTASLSAVGPRRALIVGVGDYGNGNSLANPTRDARAVARILESAYGFCCTVLLDDWATLQDVD